MQRVFFSATARCAIDLVGALGVGLYGKRSIDQIRLQYPDVEAISLDEAVERKEAMTCSRTPIPISAEQFDAALGELPPVGWYRTERAESFKSPEHFSGRVTAIYARIGERFYTFLGLCSMRHEDIIAFCKEGTH